MEVRIENYMVVDGKVNYQVTVRSNGKVWKVLKRYSEFTTLNKDLQVYFGRMFVVLPKKSYVTFLVGKSQQNIEARQDGLEEYLQALVGRQIVVNSEPLRNFLEIDKNVRLIYPPQLTCEFQFMHGVRDFQINLEQGVMFVLSSDSSLIGRLDAYMSNLKMPWYECGSHRDQSEQTMPVGCLECWIQKEAEFEKVWVKMYKQQSICCYWSDNIILVGLDNGHINYLTLDQECKRYTESMDIEQHNDAVMGVAIEQDLIHSISKDKKYRVLNLKQEQLLLDIEPTGCELTKLLLCKERHCTFISDVQGSIIIYDISKHMPCAVVRLNCHLQIISGLAIDTKRGYLFGLSYSTGDIAILDISTFGKEQYSKEISKLNGKQKSREIVWSNKRGEMMVGNKDGTITILNAKDQQPIWIDILKAHNKEITHLEWFENDTTLISSSKDKSVKAWRLPQFWGAIQEDEQTIGIRAQLQDIEQWNQDDQ